MTMNTNPIPKPDGARGEPSIDDDLAGFAHSNAQLALFECRLASDALDRASDATSHRKCLREFEVAAKAIAIALEIYEAAKGEDTSAVDLWEALMAVFWQARELASAYLGFDEDNDDAASWLRDLDKERALVGIVLAIARTMSLPHPEAERMAESLIELGWWVSSAAGDSHWRIRESDLPHQTQMTELEIRAHSIALTTDISRAVYAIRRQLAGSDSPPAQQAA